MVPSSSKDRFPFANLLHQDRAAEESVQADGIRFQFGVPHADDLVAHDQHPIPFVSLRNPLSDFSPVHVPLPHERAVGGAFRQLAEVNPISCSIRNVHPDSPSGHYPVHSSTRSSRGSGKLTCSSRTVRDSISAPKVAFRCSTHACTCSSGALAPAVTSTVSVGRNHSFCNSLTRSIRCAARPVPRAISANRWLFELFRLPSTRTTSASGTRSRTAS